MYQIKDYVVYKHDVCQIIDLKEMNNQLYYIMQPINDKSLKINIPIENENNFRKIITKENADKLIDSILSIEPLDDINDKNIEQRYKQLLNTGKHEDLIKIIKTTYLRNNDRINNKKKISEKDNAFFNLAEKYLYTELSISLNKSIEEIKNYILEKVS